MPANYTEIEKKLWASADELRATQDYHNEHIACLYDKLASCIISF